MRVLAVVFSLLVSSAAALSGCNGCRQSSPVAPAEGSAPAQAAAPSEGSVPVAEPERVISIVPAATELLFAVNAGDLLVGRSQQCNYPPAVVRVPSVGSGLSPDLESILALRPTVVIAGALQRDAEVVAAIEAAGIDVILLPDNSVDDVPRAIRMLGERLDRREDADRAASHFEQRLARLRDEGRSDAAEMPMPNTVPPQAPPGTQPTPSAPPRPEELGLPPAPEPVQHRALVVIDRDPLFAAGPDSFVGQAVELAGIDNILDEGSWVQVDDETVVRANPDMIIETRTGSPDSYWSTRFPTTPAAQNNTVCNVDPDMLSRASLRILDAIEIMRICATP